MEGTLKLLKAEGLVMGRMVSFSKGEYVRSNPHSVVYFNANIITITDGKIWYGDLDITKEGDAVKRVAQQIGEPLFILKETDCRFDNENLSAAELIKKAVWNTTQEIPFK